MNEVARIETEAAHASPEPASDERAVRIQLAEFYHLVNYFGWTEMIFNHISARLPGPESHYLVNPFGLHYDEISPDNLLRVDLSGNIVGRANYPANPAGFALHGAIHAARKDLHCVAHTHTTAVSAIALKQDGFGYDDFYGAQLFGRVAYHTFEGITVFSDEKSRMVASLGDNDVLVLRNHGVAVCERDIPRTFMLLWTVQRAAEIQCQAAQLGGEDIVLSQAIRERCRSVATDLGSNISVAKLTFDATVRRMRARS